MHRQTTPDDRRSTRRTTPRGWAAPSPSWSSRASSSAWSARSVPARPGWSRAIAEALGVDPAAISSPTFVLIHEYEGRLPIYHFDAYRLQTSGKPLKTWASPTTGAAMASAWSNGPIESAACCRTTAG